MLSRARLAFGRNLLRVGPLPSHDKLTGLWQAGVRQLVNVSGVDLGEVHPPRYWSEFELAQFSFVDIFSAEQPLPPEQAEQQVNPALYLDAAGANEREQFLTAVQITAAALARRQPTFLFCHRGRGRSPTVAAAALRRITGAPLTDVWQAVFDIQPRAQLSRISLAAVRWSCD